MTREIPYSSDMQVGKGYNLLTGDGLPSPVVTGRLTPVHLSGGQQVISQVKRIEDLETLHNSLNVSVDAGGSYLGFSASAKVDFVSESNFTRYSTYLLVKVSVSNAVLTLDDPVLIPEAVDLVSTGNSARFRERFGDCFFSGIVRGGEYFAIVEISGSDKKEREETAVAIEAAYEGLVASADLSVQIKAKKEKSTSKLNVSINVFQQGAIDTTDQDIAQVMVKAKGFPPSVAGDLAYPYALLIEDYRALKLPSDAFSPLDIENQRQVLIDLARKRFEFITLQNDIRHILRSPEDFESPDVAALRTAYNEAVEAVNTMQREASACTKDAMQCNFTKFEAAKYVLPKLTKVPDAGPTEPISLDMTLDGVLLAGEWMRSADLAQLSEDSKRNALIINMSQHARIPEQHFFQGFDTPTLVEKAAVIIFLMKAGIRDAVSLQGMSDDDQRNTLIVENAAHTQYSGGELQGMNNRELVQIGLGWFRK